MLCVQVLYALTAGIAGYVSAVQYKTMGGTNWVSTWLLLHHGQLIASMVICSCKWLQHALKRCIAYSVGCCSAQARSCLVSVRLCFGLHLCKSSSCKALFRRVGSAASVMWLICRCGTCCSQWPCSVGQCSSASLSSIQ